MRLYRSTLTWVEEQAKPLDASDITNLEAGKKELIRLRTILKSLVLDTADNPPGGSETSGGEHSELSKMKREQEIKQKIDERNNARKNKDYKLADKIRNDLVDKGVLIEDKDDKTLWKFK